MKHVYHSSKIQDLKEIKPKVSTHNIEWVYAMEKPEYSLMFLGNTNDLINQISFSDGTPIIIERFKGSLEYTYGGTRGFIYTLNKSGFKEGMTSFSEEIVCEKPCIVIKEEKIDNALVEILKLEQVDKIQIYHFPNLPQWMPKDKSDLVEKISNWIITKEETVLEDIKRFHPEILDKINIGRKK